MAPAYVPERSALDRCFSDRNPLYDPQTKQMREGAAAPLSAALGLHIGTDRPVHGSA